jgi:hypothetical protein
MLLIWASAGIAPTAVAQTPAPVSGRQWRAAINDYFASGLSRADSCAATVVARTHLPPHFKEGTAIVHAFDLHERAVCTGRADPLTAKSGMTDVEVADAFGAPIPWNSGPSCWLYHASKAGTSIDRVQVCFVNGVVSHVYLGMHA